MKDADWVLQLAVETAEKKVERMARDLVDP